MKQTQLVMGMPVTIEIVDSGEVKECIEQAFAYFVSIDETFSTYKKTSEISRVNSGKLLASRSSKEMKEVLALCEQTKKETNGYFDINRQGILDPSGLVKGWAINNVATMMRDCGIKNFYIDAGGDIQADGFSLRGKPWRVGIRDPFDQTQVVKILSISDKGVATSGTYIRGQHIYNPKQLEVPITDIVSLTVVGPNVYEADRFATAAFAMGQNGITFIETLPGFEGYMIDKNGIATFTSGFEQYIYEMD